jgi:predicted RNA methylase
MQTSTRRTVVHRTHVTMQRRAETLRRTLRDARSEGGLPAVVLAAVRLVGELAGRPLHRWRDERFDRLRNLDTRADTGALHPAYGVISAASAAFSDCVGYSPVPAQQFRRLLRALPIADPRHYAFVDLGCGKGRTLFLAADNGFSPVIGVELDPRLSGIARSNAYAHAAAGGLPEPAVAVVNNDAAGFRFPPVPTVVFLFNPFGADTLQAVLANLEMSMTSSPRHLVIAYFHAVHHQVLDASPMLRATSITPDWTIYATAPIEQV